MGIENAHRDFACALSIHLLPENAERSSFIDRLLWITSRHSILDFPGGCYTM
jgi:hypothetical protein